MPFKMKIVEKSSRGSMERHPRYDLLLNGKVVDDFYFNMTGYRGSLFTIRGSRFDLGEKGISTWKKVAGELNREAAVVIDRATDDLFKLSNAQRTMSGDVIHLTFSDGTTEKSYYASLNHYKAGIELMGQDLSYEFFADEPSHDPVRPMILNDFGDASTGEYRAWGDFRVTLAAFATKDPDWTAVILGNPPAITGKVLYAGAQNADLPKAVPGWGNAEDQGHSVVFLQTKTWDELSGQGRNPVLRDCVLPGKGIISERSEIFSKPLLLTRQRPTICLDISGEIYAEAIEKAGYRFERIALDLREEAESPSL